MIAVREQPRESAIDVQQPPSSLAGTGDSAQGSIFVMQVKDSTESNSNASTLLAGSGNSTTARKPKLPAFGKELLNLRRSGLVPVPHPWFGHVVVCIDVWDHAKGRTRLVVPTDAEPGELDFSMCAGLYIMVAYRPSVTPFARRDSLIAKLMDPRLNLVGLYVSDLDDPSADYWVKSRSRGIE